ncbi:serine protease [Streptomyces sp. NPDC048002]|uniref:serine protease n=1 Tax=Streptomyces sp. NPDC048002 TaxID=3154344 RepID=UPI0033F05865
MAARDVHGASGVQGQTLDDALVRIVDPAGRPRGLGFVADHHGTVITSHEAVDGQPRLVLSVAGGQGCPVTADAVTPLPELDLALVRTEGLGARPLPVTVRDTAEPGGYVRIPAGGWREARVLGTAPAAYTAGDRVHQLGETLELAIGTAGRDALRAGGGAAGGPVLDAETGAVIAVLATAVRSGHRCEGFAVPLRQPLDGSLRSGLRQPLDGSLRSGPLRSGPLAEVLAENAMGVPCYGADLNPAGVLELTATTVGQDAPLAATGPQPVERTSIARELAAFTACPRTSVLALVGAPGSGRTTELALLADRRHRASTLWLRGADLKDGDTSVAEAVGRALARAARILAASRSVTPEDLGDLTPERLARIVGGPLLLLLDGPEEMPPRLAHRLDAWTAGTTAWLGRTGAKLVIACGAEYWEGAGAEFPGEALYGAGTAVGGGGASLRGAVPSAAGVSEGGGTLFDSGTAFGGAVGGGGAAVRGAVPFAAGDFGGGGTLSAAGWVEGGAGAAGAATAPAGVGAAGAATAPAGVGAAGAARGRGDAPGGAPDVPGADEGTTSLPACVRLAELTPAEAHEARARYGVPEGVLGPRDARHPLTLRLLSEVRAALPDAPDTPTDRDRVLAAHLDLMCLRIAVRLAAENGLRGTAVRRLAAKVAGQVHEAARRSLGPGQGGLDRESFEAVFPWGPAPAGLGGGTGWASAVLTEGLLVPAGHGYRFAHEEFADWIQGTHLDLDEALRALVHRDRATNPHPLPVPHHRIGPVVEALLVLARQRGPLRLALRLQELADALDSDPHSWWAARLLSLTLLRVPDATPYTDVLRLLADRIVGWRRQHRPVPAEFGPDFWTALPVPDDTRLDLLHRLVLADTRTGPRYLDAVADLLTADAGAVQRHLVHWFHDDRPLPATPHATVARAAQALLHTHRHGALDDLTETLVEAAHPRADELLAVLAEEEPSALCRAVDRWAHDERPARRVAAMAYGLRVAPLIRTAADRELLRYAALALLARPADNSLHGGALALLVRDPHTRARHLPLALRHFAAADPRFPPSALAGALTTHPEPVLDAFRERLRRPGAGPALRILADVTTPSLARRVAALVQEAVERRPETAGDVAAYVDRRLEHGPVARAVLFPLVTGLLDGGPEHVRAALAGVLAVPGTPGSRPLRHELLEFLLAREREPAVLDAVLHAAAQHDDGEGLRELVHRTGLLLARTPHGATVFDRGLVDLGRHVPGFAARVAGWLTDAPQDWAPVVGPGTRRTIGNLAGVHAPA